MLIRAAILAILSGSSVGDFTEAVPVMIGEHEELDACTSQGEVRVTEATLRIGPDQSFPRVLRLKHGALLHICSGSKDGAWTGVVLAQDGILDCGVSSPVASPRPYNGPCVSGWLPSSAVQVTAG